MFAITGDGTGLVKRTNLGKTGGTKTVAKAGDQTKGHEVVGMCHSRSGFIAAFSSGDVVEWTMSMKQSRTLTQSAIKNCVGIDYLGPEASSSQLMLMCGAQGNCEVWRTPNAMRDDVDVDANAYETSELLRDFVMPGPLTFGTVDHRSFRIAVGGKDNDLKVWDFRQEDVVRSFEAKNVPHDYLNLRVPVWPTTALFFPRDSSRILVGSAYHKMRVYDTKAQTRPVADFILGDHRITTMAFTHNPYHVIVGDTHGRVSRVDMRTKRLVNAYKGVGGSARQISMHPTLDKFCVASLDRWLHMFDVESKTPFADVYLKQQLHTVLFGGPRALMTEIQQQQKKTQQNQKPEQEKEKSNSNSNSSNDSKDSEAKKPKKKKTTSVDVFTTVPEPKLLPADAKKAKKRSRDYITSAPAILPRKQPSPIPSPPHTPSSPSHTSPTLSPSNQNKHNNNNSSNNQDDDDNSNDSDDNNDDDDIDGDDDDDNSDDDNSNDDNSNSNDDGGDDSDDSDDEPDAKKPFSVALVRPRPSSFRQSTIERRALSRNVMFYENGNKGLIAPPRLRSKSGLKKKLAKLPRWKRIQRQKHVERRRRQTKKKIAARKKEI